MKTKFVMILPALLIIFLLINCSNSKTNAKDNKPANTPVIAMDTSLQDTYWKLIALGEKPVHLLNSIIKVLKLS